MLKRLQEKQNDLFTDLIKFYSASKSHDGSKKGKEKGSRKKKNQKNSTQLPEKETVNRQVKTRLQWPTRSSYHTMYLSDFPTCKTERNQPFMKRLSADFYKEMTSLELG